MILSFDKFERYELPQVTLCNPNSRATEVDGKITITDAVGLLSNPKGMDLKLNFNAPHELSFDYYRHKSNDPIKQSFYDSIYEAIQTDRYIYLTDIGYFVISSVTDSDEDNIDKKSISCKSCEENELATAEGLYLKEGTYYLHTDNSDGLLDLFFSKTAGWTMGYIDPSLLTKPYYVEETKVDNGYNFLYTTIQDMAECIVEPDIIKRTISVYSRAYYAEHHLTDIHIAKYNLLKHKTVEENDEDKYTALNVQGKDENLEIRIVNPTGVNVIYNFESRYSWMSPALQTAVTKWQEKCASVEDEYLNLQQGYYNDMQNIVFPLEEDIKVLELQLKEKEQTRDTIVYGDYDKEKYDEIQEEALKQVNAEIQNISTQISDKKAQLETEKNKIEANYSQPISQINKNCALDTTAIDIDGNTIFTVELLNELMTHIKPTDYVDEYMLVTENMSYPERFEKAKELMDRAQSQLVKISSGQKTYSIDTRSFLFNKQFRHFSEQLCAGAIIYVETKNDIMEQLHLTGIDINFDEKTTNFTLGNKYDRSDLKALYDEALGQNSKSFSELKYIASIVEDQQKQLDYQKNWVADLRTLTLNNVLTSEDQAIEINNRGLIGRKRRLDENGEWAFDENGNPLFYEEQVKLINNTLVFTEDNWKTASTAVGKIAVGYDNEGNVKYSYGINGQVLIGELILGNNLVLTGTGAGIKITDSSGNDAFYADDDGNLVLSGTIYAKRGEIGGWEIQSDYLGHWGAVSETVFLSYTGKTPYNTLVNGRDYTEINKTFYLFVKDKFGVDDAGNMYAKGGKIGNFTINDGGFGDTSRSGTNGSGIWFQANPATGGYYINCANYGDNSKYFRVGQNGVVYASGAQISGIITATNGAIGNWTLKDGLLYSSNGSYAAGMASSSGYVASDPAIWCGMTYYDTPWEHTANGSVWTDHCKFYVTNAGHLHAADATITGTIKAGTILQDGVKVGTSANSAMGDFSNGSIWQYGRVGSAKANMCVTSSFASISGGNNNGVSGASLTAYAGAEGYLTGTWRLSSGEAVESDRNVKNTIYSLSDKYSNLFDNLRPVTYRYNEGTSGRLHTGFIAQEVKSALDIAEIDSQDFAGLVIFNRDTEDELWALRYEEFIALNTSEIQKAKSRIINLENTVAELKTQIQSLTAG